jgi:hypothetical protein
MKIWTRSFLAALFTALAFTSGITNAFAANRVILSNDLGIPLTASSDEHTVNTLDSLRGRPISR